jgi:hypothetical protein
LLAAGIRVDTSHARSRRRGAREADINATIEARDRPAQTQFLLQTSAAIFDENPSWASRARSLLLAAIRLPVATVLLQARVGSPGRCTPPRQSHAWWVGYSHRLSGIGIKERNQAAFLREIFQAGPVGRSHPSNAGRSAQAGSVRQDPSGRVRPWSGVSRDQLRGRCSRQGAQVGPAADVSLANPRCRPNSRRWHRRQTRRRPSERHGQELASADALRDPLPVGAFAQLRAASIPSSVPLPAHNGGGKRVAFWRSGRGLASAGKSRQFAECGYPHDPQDTIGWGAIVT